MKKRFLIFVLGILFSGCYLGYDVHPYYVPDIYISSENIFCVNGIACNYIKSNPPVKIYNPNEYKIYIYSGGNQYEIEAFSHIIIDN